MFILGLQGSPRKKGNTDFFLSTFLAAAEKQGAETEKVYVPGKNIQPCKGCGYCEKKGFCIIKDDDMKSGIYPLLRKADIVVAATPIYFYNTPAQLKALIDRCQSLWSRIYRFNVKDPGAAHKLGYILSVGATKGRNLFDGLHLTAKYFFDAVNADYAGSITYRQIENSGDLKKHPSVLKDIEDAVARLVTPLMNRKKILFACRENTCRSQMAGAFAQFLAGDKIDAYCAGSSPADQINPVMEEAMMEKGIDMAFRKPVSIDNVISKVTPDMIVTMGCGEACPFIPETEKIDWDFPDPAGKPIEFMRQVRDEIEQKIKALAIKISG